MINSFLAVEKVVKFSEVLGVTNFKPFSLGKYERKFATKNPQNSSRWGGGGKNAKFHHLNLLGAALHTILNLSYIPFVAELLQSVILFLRIN